MNCAMPSAPAGLETVGWKLLSCQINRVRNETGRPCARAEESISRQMLLTRVSPPLGAAPSPAAEARPALRNAEMDAAARIDRFGMTSPLPQVVLPSLSHPRFTCHANIARAPSHNSRAISAAGLAGARAADWPAQVCIVAISSDLTATSRIACVNPRCTG